MRGYATSWGTSKWLVTRASRAARLQWHCSCHVLRVHTLNELHVPAVSCAVLDAASCLQSLPTLPPFDGAGTWNMVLEHATGFSEAPAAVAVVGVSRR
jgi:hypothetical protein